MAELEVPIEIITEILTRLPVKPLSRFKCVSKSWNSLISSPSFIILHLKQSLVSNPNPNIVISGHSAISALIPDNHNNNVLHFIELNHPLKHSPTRPKAGLIESCNGILLISGYAKVALFLYNPANNTYRLLPHISAPFWNDDITGFGYDSHTDDYKVIRVVQTAHMGKDIWVYTMRDNVWKYFRGESDLMRKHFIKPGHAVGANGVLHFMAETVERKPVLMCFDVRTEAFSIVDYPELECCDLSKLSMSMKELCGCLCLVVNYGSKGLESGDELLYVDVWEMRESGKEVSWVKLFRIQGGEFVGKDEPPCMSLRLVSYSKDKGKVLVVVDGGLFVWYDLVTKKVKRVKTHGLRGEDAPYVAMTYVESLVSLSNDNDKTLTVCTSEGRSASKKTIEVSK